MEERHCWLAGEPALREVLADPIVEYVMRRDRLSPADLRRAIDRGQQALRAGPAGRPGQEIRPRPPGPEVEAAGGPPGAG